MFKKFADRYKNFQKIRVHKKIAKQLTHLAQVDLIESDLEGGHYLCALNQNLEIELYYYFDTATISASSTLRTDPNLINLSNFSNLVNNAGSVGITCSSPTPTLDGNTTICFTKTTPYCGQDSLEDLMIDFYFALKVTSWFLDEQATVHKNPKLDLSMFQNLELSNFNTKDLGEKKEFIFGSWAKFKEAITRACKQGEITQRDLDLFLAELDACEEFEEKHTHRLASIGDVVWQEIVWNRDLLEHLSDDDRKYPN